jgi:hypothetical protein
VVTLAELRDSLFPTARAVGAPAPGRGAPEIAWVRVLRGRTPALDDLEPGDLVIVPPSALAIVAPGTAEMGVLVEALAMAPVSGVVVPDPEGDPRRRRAVEAFETALGEAGLPGLRVDAEEPAVLERSVIGFLVNRRAEVERRAGALEDRLHALALAGADLAAYAAAIAGFLARAVAIEDAAGRPLAVHAPAEVGGAGADAAAYLANPAGTGWRIPIPGGPAPPRPAAGGLPSGGRGGVPFSVPLSAPRGAIGGGRAGTPAGGGAAGPRSAGPLGGASGSLVLLGDEPPGELARAAAQRAAAFLALEVGRRPGAAPRVRGPEALPPAGPPWVVLVARQGTDQGTAGAPTAAELEAREAVRQEVRRLAAADRIALRGDAWSLELRVVVAVSRDDPVGLGLAGEMARLLGRPVAISRPFGEPAERPAAEAEARSTLEAVLELRHPPAVARADRLPAYRLLSGLHNIPDAIRQARALLAPLRTGRRRWDEAVVSTLQALLEQPGRAEAAAALGIHRNTLAYRVRWIEGRTGWDLADPDLRVALLLAVRIVQEAQQSDGGG